jgi:hypothetical protein
MNKKSDNQNTKKESASNAQSGSRKIQDEIKEKPIGNKSGPEAVDRPGFDLGGSTGDTTAGAGLGLGEDAGENGSDRSLPGRPAGATLSIPRWSGPTPKVLPSSDNDKVSKFEDR